MKKDTLSNSYIRPPKKIDHLHNAKGEFDYGHAWGYYEAGFIDIYGRNLMKTEDDKWEFVE